MSSKKSTVHDCKVIDLGKIENQSGNITIVQNGEGQFDVKRIYYLYDVPSGAGRGGHAHYDLEQYIVAASGSFDVVLDDGNEKRRVFLNRPNQALHIVPGLWRELDEFSSGSICLVLASMEYSEQDYIRNFEKFKDFKNEI